jgi:hypothetical protein
VVPAGETACGYASYLVARPDRLRSDAITIPEHDRLVPGLSWGLTGPRPPGLFAYVWQPKDLPCGSANLSRDADARIQGPAYRRQNPEEVRFV